MQIHEQSIHALAHQDRHGVPRTTPDYGEKPQHTWRSSALMSPSRGLQEQPTVGSYDNQLQIVQYRPTDGNVALPQPSKQPITDHFEVLSKTRVGRLQSILVRCGDSSLKRDVRPSDGLFEIAAEVHVDKGYAEFRLKSVFYQGLGKAEKKPIGGFGEWLHRQYTKLWMESAVNILSCHRRQISHNRFMACMG